MCDMGVIRIDRSIIQELGNIDIFWQTSMKQVLRDCDSVLGVCILIQPYTYHTFTDHLHHLQAFGL